MSPAYCGGVVPGVVVVVEPLGLIDGSVGVVDGVVGVDDIDGSVEGVVDGVDIESGEVVELPLEPRLDFFFDLDVVDWSIVLIVSPVLLGIVVCEDEPPGIVCGVVLGELGAICAIADAGSSSAPAAMMLRTFIVTLLDCSRTTMEG